MSKCTILYDQLSFVFDDCSGYDEGSADHVKCEKLGLYVISVQTHSRSKRILLKG